MMSFSTSKSVSHESSLELSPSCIASFPFHGDTCQIEIPSDETQRDHICNSAVSFEIEAAPLAKESHPDNGADLLQCLFCSFTAQTLEQNFFHMFQSHGTFIPEQEHLMNPQGLVAHLSNQINQSHKCISCGSTKTTTSGVQSHMIDRGHCMLSFETDPLLESFWDFFVDPSDSEEHDQYPGILRERLSSPNHYDSPLGSRVYSADLSLRLPSGQTLGHRSLSRYYRQNLHSKPLSISRSPILGITDASVSTSEALQPSSQSRLQPTAVKKAMIGVPETKRREVKAVAKRAQRSEWKRRGHDMWAVQKERNQQKFFRNFQSHKQDKEDLEDLSSYTNRALTCPHLSHWELHSARSGHQAQPHPPSGTACQQDTVPSLVKSETLTQSSNSKHKFHILIFIPLLFSIVAVGLLFHSDARVHHLI